MGPDLGDSEGWTPLLFEDVEADAAIAVYVGVVHLCLEIDLRHRETAQTCQTFEARLPGCCCAVRLSLCGVAAASPWGA